jgi:hypothetical protein
LTQIWKRVSQRRAHLGETTETGNGTIKPLLGRSSKVGSLTRGSGSELGGGTELLLDELLGEFGLLLNRLV